MKLFIYLVSILSLNAVELWSVHDHPAKLNRVISGFSQPCRTLDIRAEYPGRLLSFPIQEGQTLSATNRQTVATQDSRLAKLNHDASANQIISQKKQIELLEQELNSLQRATAYRKLELERIRQLSNDGKVAKANFDRVLYEYDQATLAESRTLSSIAVQTQAHKQASIEHELSKEKLQRFTHSAPEGWTLNKRLREPGSWLNAGEALAQFVDLRELSLFFRLSHEEIEQLPKKELKLKHKLTQKLIPARIHHIDLEFDEKSRKQLVEIRVSGKDLKHARGGQEFSLTLSLNYSIAAVYIPKAYVFTKLEKYYVKMENQQDRAINVLRKNKDNFIVEASSFKKQDKLQKIDD